MDRKPWIEFSVGLFLLLGVASLLVLAFKVSGLTGYVGPKSFEVHANFDNIGGLKPRSKVTIAGVKVGEISEVNLDPKTFKARVSIKINAEATQIPSDSSATILTEGLVGANYISLTPGFADTNLKDGSVIMETHSALILENLIGQFLINSAQKKEPEK